VLLSFFTCPSFHHRYPSVYIFRYENFRNDKFKGLREQLRDSTRFCLGSNKVLQVALGITAADEYRTSLSELATRIRGSSGLLFSRLPREEIISLIDAFEHVDYARAGARATENFVVAAGPVLQFGEPIAHTLEPTLRQHGMPTKLNKGVVELVSEYTVCNEGETLSTNAAALLRIFGMKQALFKMKAVGVWENDTYTQLCEEGDIESDDDDGNEGGDERFDTDLE